MFRYIAKTLYLDLANDLQFGTDGIFINLLLKHTAILGFTPFVVCPLHLKLVIMWLLLGRLICSDGMLLIWWCKLDITFSGTLVNTHRHYVFFLFFLIQIAAICQEAGMHAVRKNRYVILPKDFEKGYRTNVKKPETDFDFYKWCDMSVELVSCLSIVSF